MNYLIRKAGIVLNTKIKQYKIHEVDEILQTEYPINHTVTDTNMSALSLICSLPDNMPENKLANQQMLEMVFMHNPNLNHKDMFERTPLHIAARSGNETAVDMILSKARNPESEADVIDLEAQSLGGETILMKAAECGNIDICIQLCKEGCNPFVQNYNGKTAD